MEQYHRQFLSSHIHRAAIAVDFVMTLPPSELALTTPNSHDRRVSPPRTPAHFAGVHALSVALCVAACPQPPGETGPGTDTSAGATNDTSTVTGDADTSTVPSTSESTSTGPDASTGPVATTDTGPTATDTGSSTSTGPDTASDTGAPAAACGNGIVEPPELCATAQVSVAGGPVLTGLVIADFTDDGEADVAVLSRRDLVLSQPATIQILAGDPVDGLVPVASLPVGDASDHRGGVRPGTFAADFDQDGRVDLAFIDDVQLFNGLQAHLRVWLNQGDASFEPAVDLAFEPYVKMLSAVGDFDGDGLADVVTADPGALQVRPGSGDGSLADPLPPFAVVNVSWLRAAKLDGDARSDLLVERKGGGAVLLAQPGGGFLELPAPPCSEGDLEHDVDADGHLDLVCRVAGALTVHRGLGDGKFAPGIESQFGDNVDLPVGALGDFDGDGTLDTIATIYNDVYVARGAGDGSFGPLTLLYEDPDFDAIGPRYGVGLDVNKDSVHDLLRSKSAGSTFTLVFSMSAP